MTVSSVELLVLEYLMGLGYSLVNTANLRLGMAISPEMGRSHFLAIFQVVSNLTLGLAPVLWGLLIDACAQVHGRAWVLELNRYSLFFIGAGVCFAVMIGLTRKLEEPSASKVQHLLREILIHAPQRVWSSITAK
jgi:MFS family permease